MKCRNRIIAVLCIFGALLTQSVHGETDEDTMKAVAIEKILRFLTWPSEHELSNATGDFVIGVLGNEPFQKRLETVYAEHTIKKKQVIINRIKKMDDIAGCHLLYIPNSEAKNLPKILEQAKKYKALTISDTDGFGKKGVHINLYIENNKLRFEINERDLKEAGITIDPLLLRAARNVNPLGTRRNN